MNFHEQRIHRIGFDKMCSMRLFDDSISPYHAMIKYRMEYSPQLKKNIAQVMVEDMFSRYGTFIFMNEPVEVMPNSRLCVQVGHSIMYFNQYQSLSYWCCKYFCQIICPCT